MQISFHNVLKFRQHQSVSSPLSLREKCPYSEFFWSVFSRMFCFLTRREGWSDFFIFRQTSHESHPRLHVLSLQISFHNVLEFRQHQSISSPLSLREKCPYSEFFWSVFSRIRTEYGEILRTLFTQCVLASTSVKIPNHV